MTSYINDRFTLRYISSGGMEIELFNLSARAAEEIEHIECGFGSHDFERVSQGGRNYSQQEIDLRRHGRGR